MLLIFQVLFFASTVYVLILTTAASSIPPDEALLVKRSWNPDGTWNPYGFREPPQQDPDELVSRTQGLSLRINTGDHDAGSSRRHGNRQEFGEASGARSARMYRQQHHQVQEQSGAQTSRAMRSSRHQYAAGSGGGHSQAPHYQGVFPFLSTGQPLPSNYMAQGNMNHGSDGFPVLSTGARRQQQQIYQQQHHEEVEEEEEEEEEEEGREGGEEDEEGDDNEAEEEDEEQQYEVDPRQELRRARRLAKLMRAWNTDPYHMFEFLYAKCRLQDEDNRELKEKDWLDSLAEEDPASLQLCAEYREKALKHLKVVRDYFRQAHKNIADATGPGAEYSFVKVYWKKQHGFTINSEQYAQLRQSNDTRYLEIKANWDHYKDISFRMV